MDFDPYLLERISFKLTLLTDYYYELDDLYYEYPNIYPYGPNAYDELTENVDTIIEYFSGRSKSGDQFSNLFRIIMGSGSNESPFIPSLNQFEEFIEHFINVILVRINMYKKLLTSVNVLKTRFKERYYTPGNLGSSRSASHFSTLHFNDV